MPPLQDRCVFKVACRLPSFPAVGFVCLGQHKSKVTLLHDGQIISEKPTQKSKKVTIRRLPRFALVKRSFAVTALIMSAASQQHSVGSDGELYRHDGVRITHDPFSDGMVSCFQSRYTRGRRWKDFNKRQLFCLYTRILLSRTLQCAGEDASTSAHCTVFIVD